MQRTQTAGFPRAPNVRHLALFIAAAAIVTFTFLLRYLALAGFPNDQFEHLAGATQVLLAAWPNRDCVDPGRQARTPAASQVDVETESAPLSR